jgi:hypothetical protein
MGGVRAWIYRVLVLAATGLFVYSWFAPWWMAHIEALDIDAVKIFPFGMSINMGNYPHWLAGADQVMPGWFTPLMWVYFGIFIAVILYCVFATTEKRINLGKLSMSLHDALIACVGISFIVVVATAVTMIAINAPNFYDGVLNGTIYVEMSEHEASYVTMGLQNGYWIACCAGPVLLLLALLRKKIAGNNC